MVSLVGTGSIMFTLAIASIHFWRRLTVHASGRQFPNRRWKLSLRGQICRTHGYVRHKFPAAQKWFDRFNDLAELLLRHDLAIKGHGLFIDINGDRVGQQVEGNPQLFANVAFYTFLRRGRSRIECDDEEARCREGDDDPVFDSHFFLLVGGDDESLPLREIWPAAILRLSAT
jgi:hypothetical protein